MRFLVNFVGKILMQSHISAATILIWETAFDLICSWQKMKVWLWWQQDTIVITYSDHLTSVTRAGISSALPHWCENKVHELKQRKHWKAQENLHQQLIFPSYRFTTSVFCSASSPSISTPVSWGVSYFELIRKGQSPLTLCLSGFERGPHCVALAAPKLPLLTKLATGSQRPPCLACSTSSWGFCMLFKGMVRKDRCQALLMVYLMVRSALMTS